MLYTQYTVHPIIIPSNFSFDQRFSDNFQLLPNIIQLKTPNIGPSKQTKYNQEYGIGEDSCKRIP